MGMGWRTFVCVCGTLVVSACGSKQSTTNQMPATGCPPDCAGAGGSMASGGTSGAAPTSSGASGVTGGGGHAGTTSSRGGTAGMAGATPMASAGTSGAGTAGTTPGTAGAGVAGSGVAGMQGAAGAGGSMAQTLPPITDYAQKGPFMTTITADTGPGNNYTIYRPDPLGANGFLHSPIIFGPGILTSGATDYNTFLTHLATHGYVVISVNSLGGGPGDPGNDTAMRDGLDWLIAQNTATGVYQGKLAVDRAVTMGYSIGATSAVLISNHPAVITSVAIHGHEPMKTAKPHGPVLLLTGNGATELPAGPQATLQAITSVPVILALYDGQAHITVIGDQLAQGKPEFTLITAWLRYWVNGDDAAKGYFWGANCKICSEPAWMVTKNAAWDAQNL